MNKRQKKKQAKKIELFGAFYADSYRSLRTISRQSHEFRVWKARYDRKYKRCKSCRNLLNCEMLFGMNINEIANCKEFKE